MKQKDLRKTVIEWAKSVGEREAHTRLVNRMISPSTTEKLIAGRYPSEPNDLYRSILLEEMAKDGFTLAGKAS